MKKIGMLFPGYGSQYVGMGKELYDTSRIVQEYFEEASNCLNENFVKLCFASSDAELGKMSNAYSALFLVSVSTAMLLQEKGIKPDVIAGYNLGEYSALCTAGGLSFPDGLYLLNKFACFYQEGLDQMHDIAILQVIGVLWSILKDECAAISLNVAPIIIAFYHSPTDYTVVGSKEAIEALKVLLAGRKGAKINELSLAVGLHSSLMDPIVEQFVIYLTKVDFHDLNVPLINSVYAKQVQAGEEIKEGIIKQINHSIIWDQVLAKFADCDLLIEVGPGTQLSFLAKEQYPDKKIVSVQKQVDINELLQLIDSDGTTPISESGIL